MKGVIEKVIVWVRFCEMSIEYYDIKVLHLIEDIIGKMDKVDQNHFVSGGREVYEGVCRG